MIHKLIGDHILVEKIDTEKKTESGIIVGSQGYTNGITGLVLLVGQGPLDKDGKHVSISCNQGDIVLYRDYANWDQRSRQQIPDAQIVEWTEGDRRFRIIPGHYLIAVLGETETQ